MRRAYSICSSPNSGELRIAIKSVLNGHFSKFANDNLKIGDIIEVGQPEGKFTFEPNADKQKNYAGFVAGSGITPILSIIKTHLATEPNSTFKLFYLNRTVKSIIFKEEIEQLKNVYFNRFEIFHFLTKEHRPAELFNGRFTKEKNSSNGCRTPVSPM